MMMPSRDRKKKIRARIPDLINRELGQVHRTVGGRRARRLLRLQNGTKASKLKTTMMMALMIRQNRTVATPVKGIFEGKGIPVPSAAEGGNRARTLTKKTTCEKVGIGLRMASGQQLGTDQRVIEKEIRTVLPENGQRRTGSVYSPVQASQRSQPEQEIHRRPMMLRGSG
jgi:hypothetical protein